MDGEIEKEVCERKTQKCEKIGKTGYNNFHDLSYLQHSHKYNLLFQWEFFVVAEVLNSMYKWW